MEAANLTTLEVGYGIGKGSDAFATGSAVARQAMININQHPLSAVLVFASVCYDLEELLRGIHWVVGDAPVLGTTTAGEIYNGPQQESVVAVALASPFLKVRAGLGNGVSSDWERAMHQAVSEPEILPFFSSKCDGLWLDMTRQGKAAFALLFSPGNTHHTDSCSYEILEGLKRLSGELLPIVGGSSADNWRMESNYVLLGRHAYPDSLLVAIFETQLRFGIGLTHGLRPTPRRATVTRARGHEVLQLDGRPATEVYARLLGTTQEALAGKHLTLATRQPVGSSDHCGRYNINVASFITPRGGIRFSQPIPEGSLLTIMEADQDNMISAGKEGLRKALVRGGVTDPAVAFVFSCALRYHMLGERTVEEISGIREILAGVPAMGFYSFGEQGLADDGVNRHNNSVISVLVLSRELSYAAQVSMENERLRKEQELEVVKYRQAEDALKKVHEDLERRVAERIAESSKATEQLRHEIIGRRDAEHTLRIRDWAIASSINGIAFADLQGNVTYANDSCLKIWGYKSEKEVLGKSIVEFWESRKPSALIDYLLNNGSWIGELVAKKKDGSPFDVQLSACLVMDKEGRPTCMMGSFVDISERKRIERDLAQKNGYSKLRADIWMLASNKSLEEDELIQRLLDKIGPVIGVSRACFNRFTGEDPHNSDLKCVLEWCDEGVKPSIGITVPAYLIKYAIRDDFFVVTEQAALEMMPRPLRVVAKPVISSIARALDLESVLVLPYFLNEKMEGMLTFDVCKGKKEKMIWTEEMKGIVYEVVNIVSNHIYQKKVEAALKEREEQLRQAQKIEAIGTLAGGIAHEFNNILWIITGNTELAVADIPESSPARYPLERVEKACMRAKDLVAQILSFSRQKEEERVPIKIGIILKEALKLLRASIPSNIEIRHHILTRSDTILGDPTQIHEVIMNLCTNAAHAMRKKGGILELRIGNSGLREEDVGLDQGLNSEKYVTLTVSDTGHGMTPEVMAQIFNPFFTTKRVGEGTGMGLSMVHGIVKGHGGTITVSSGPGKGTTFRICFPSIENDIKTEAEIIEPLPKGNERILLVDDEEEIVGMAKQMLERLGYKVESRTGSIEALETFRAQPDVFDLVISDMTMPCLTGEMLVRKLMTIRPDIPIILCTGYNEMISEEKAKGMGIREFIMKPIVMRELAYSVRKAIDRK